jgi:hypothetical protein
VLFAGHGHDVFEFGQGHVGYLNIKP